APDAGHAHVDLDQVVEDGRRVVFDGQRAHDELVSFLADLHAEQAELAVVLDSGTVEVGEIPAVVDDPLCVGVGKSDADHPAELKAPALHDAPMLVANQGSDPPGQTRSWVWLRGWPCQFAGPVPGTAPRL